MPGELEKASKWWYDPPGGPIQSCFGTEKWFREEFLPTLPHRTRYGREDHNVKIVRGEKQMSPEEIYSAPTPPPPQERLVITYDHQQIQATIYKGDYDRLMICLSPQQALLLALSLLEKSIEATR